MEPLFTADDWGISPGVNEGILHLAQKGVVKRVSCMVNTAYFESHLQELKAVPGLRLGLHLNVTHGRPSVQEARYFALVDRRGAFLTLKKHLVGSLTPGKGKRISQELARALDIQIELLKAAVGRVDYVDGHEHIHLLPGAIKSLIPVLEKHQITEVRLPLDPALLATSKAPVYLLAMFARNYLKGSEIKSLPCVYPSLRKLGTYTTRLPLLTEWAGKEIITHPAKTMDFAALGIADTYLAPRLEEYSLLSKMIKTP